MGADGVVLKRTKYPNTRKDMNAFAEHAYNSTYSTPLLISGALYRLIPHIAICYQLTPFRAVSKAKMSVSRQN